MADHFSKPVYTPQAPKHGVCAGVVLKRISITRARLRYWVATGIVSPTIVGHGTRAWQCFTPEDVEHLRRVKWLLDKGLTLRAAAKNAHRVPVLEERRRLAEMPTPKYAPGETPEPWDL
ncbi:MAG: helix-turn-helix domain-containing protein [Planctomycetota bacterium]|nr:helix-turn-helix domain-containing protein [Planctomycetota bacterium]